MPRIAAGNYTLQVQYDFAIDGGAVGNITLRGGRVPGGSIVTDVFTQLVTPLAGGTGTDTVSLTLESAGDVQAAVARNGAPWTGAGSKRHSFTSTTAPIVTTTERGVVMNISASVLTAGKFNTFIRYTEPVT
jgi:hypothetical protein